MENKAPETEPEVIDEDELDDQDGPDEEPPEPVGLKRPSAIKAIKAKCFDCCGDMMDGKIDCEINTCPLYWWQPYRKGIPNLAWQTEGTHLQKNRTAMRIRMKEIRRKYGEEDPDA